MANKKETLQGWDAPPPPYTPPYAGSESLSSPKEKSGHVSSKALIHLRMSVIPPHGEPSLSGPSKMFVAGKDCNKAMYFLDSQDPKPIKFSALYLSEDKNECLDIEMESRCHDFICSYFDVDSIDGIFGIPACKICRSNWRDWFREIDFIGLVQLYDQKGTFSTGKRWFYRTLQRVWPVHAIFNCKYYDKEKQRPLVRIEYV